MEKNIFAQLIAQQLNLQERAVNNTLALLDEGCTIPFISRYRKERTGGLDEVQIAAISTQYERFKEIQKRKETVLKTIADLDKLTPELEKRITDCWDATELEDIYLPYKPKRRTRAQVAREQTSAVVSNSVMPSVVRLLSPRRSSRPKPIPTRPQNTVIISIGRNPSNAALPTVCWPCAEVRAKAFSASASPPTMMSASNGSSAIMSMATRPVAN